MPIGTLQKEAFFTSRADIWIEGPAAYQMANPELQKGNAHPVDPERDAERSHLFFVCVVGVRARKELRGPMAKILVVEDEIGVADLLATILEEEGHDVRTAADGLAGLASMGDCRPELIVTDTTMPIMDGPTMVRAMDDDPALAAIPVIAMSALPDSAEGYTRYAAFMFKPFRVRELIALVGRMLERKG